MGRIAQTLVATLRQQSQVADQLTEGLPDDFPSPEELAAEGYDPQHIQYIAAQNFASLFAESVNELDEFDDYSRTVAVAEDEYMPSSPPMSPITQSFFWTWALFDLQFGPDRETVGSCLADVMRSMQAPAEMLVVLDNYNRSRMGVYQHCGRRRGRIRLRELVTGDELLCHSTSGYRGRKNELWYVRLCPPVSEEFDYHVSITTPYVLTEASPEDWTAYLNKQLLDAEDKRHALHDLLKYGRDGVRWMEFVFQAYHHFQYDAIFLAGIPNVAASLPHSPVHDEAGDDVAAVDGENEVAGDCEEEILWVKLTEVQRQVIANLCPDLLPRLKLAEKNQRTVAFGQSELQRVINAAQESLPKTKGPRRIALKKIINIEEPRRRHTSLVPPATIYQFKITLTGSKPPIWRRIQVRDCTLADFHNHIQGAMGWMDSHLHEFNIGGERYSAPPPMMDPSEFDTIDATTVRLSELISGHEKFRCQYLYDFGDCWEHQIELEKVCAAEAKASYPRCVDGERASPPEDCGGIWGFYEFVEAVTDRKHPEYQERKEWYGGSFNPNAFDKQKASREMRR